MKQLRIPSLRKPVRYLIDHLQLEWFPLFRQLNGYNRTDFLGDLRAGLNVALLGFPQGMAYAMIAKLPLQYGVYCSAAAALLAPWFSRSGLVVLGPTNATAVMLLSIFLTLPPEIDRLTATTTLVFLVGIFLLIGAVFQVASLLKFVSRSVIIGYITGAALLIIANQLNHVFGIQAGGSSSFFPTLVATVKSLPEIHWTAFAVALSAIATIFVVRKYSSRLPDAAISLVVASLVGMVLGVWGEASANLNPISVSTWHPTPPTLTPEWIFLLAGPALAVGFLAAMECSVMVKTTAAKTGEKVNLNQEMLSLGVANVGSSFLMGMPASGSLTRSALNASSGGRTGLSSIFSGLFLLIGAVLLGPLTQYIPKAALAGLVIVVAFSLLDVRRIFVTIRSTKSDAAVVIITFIAALFTPLDFAIFLGVAVSIALFLHKASSPRLIEYSFNTDGNLAEAEEKRNDPHIAIIHVEGELFFGAADLFREEIRRVSQEPQLRVLVLRMRNAHHLDATSILALEDLIVSMQKSGRHLLISGASKEVYKILRDTKVLETLGRDNFFLASPSNPNLATRNALKRAQILLGDEKVEVRIYHDPGNKTDSAKK